MFNVPIFEKTKSCEKILLAGMGGGYDVYCALPIFFALKKSGVNVCLASFSFSDIEHCKSSKRLSPTLAGISAEDENLTPYFPEYHLTKWFREELGEEETIWCFHKTGAKPLQENYRLLKDHLDFDGLILVDGGVDSLVRGNEEQTASLIEDALSLFAADTLEDLKLSITAITAFGVELGLSFGQILENMAALIKKDCFLGNCMLVKSFAEYQLYESAVLYCQGQAYQDPSVINSSIISAVRGEFGNYHLTKKTMGSQLQINPLMSQYWFFETSGVAGQNQYLSQLGFSETFMDAMGVFMSVRGFLPARKPHNQAIHWRF
ncbi:MAG TPA: DUF1152 domain-containing protein [Calditrichia bacterium]|nr:DUF1152 domain-containing protein [Calditrichia bacterium]